MSNDLSTFLLHRIAEDEAVARKALHHYGHWRYNPNKHNVSPTTGIAEESVFTGAVGPAAITVASTGPTDDPQSMADAQHIARHDPARILAECDAKRRIVVRCQEMLTAAVPMAVHLAQQTLTDLARPHADHPDYRQEWKP